MAVPCCEASVIIISRLSFLFPFVGDLLIMCIKHSTIIASDDRVYFNLLFTAIDALEQVGLLLVYQPITPAEDAGL